MCVCVTSREKKVLIQFVKAKSSWFCVSSSSLRGQTTRISLVVKDSATESCT